METNAQNIIEKIKYIDELLKIPALKENSDLILSKHLYQRKLRKFKSN